MFLCVYTQALQDWCAETTLVAMHHIEQDEELQDKIDEKIMAEFCELMCPINHRLMRDPVVCAGSINGLILHLWTSFAYTAFIF